MPAAPALDIAAIHTAMLQRGQLPYDATRADVAYLLFCRELIQTVSLMAAIEGNTPALNHLGGLLAEDIEIIDGIDNDNGPDLFVCCRGFAEALGSFYAHHFALECTAGRPNLVSHKLRVCAVYLYSFCLFGAAEGFTVRGALMH